MTPLHTRRLVVDPHDPDEEMLQDAAAVLRRGGLVAFPTETVYGLGAHALDRAAVSKIFDAKGRPATDPLIVHVASLDGLRRIVTAIPDIVGRLATRFWPGPLTMILPKAAAVPDEVTAGLANVAVRFPSHPVARRLIELAEVPVAAPSANRFSRPSPTRADHVLADLDGRIDIVLDAGPTTIGVESTIVDLTVDPPLVRRPGGVTIEVLREVLPNVQSLMYAGHERVAQLAPGQLLRHYAPRAPLTLYVGPLAALVPRVASDLRTAAASGQRLGLLAPREDLVELAPAITAIARSGRVQSMPYGSRGDRAAAARELFHALRTLDAEPLDAIYALAPAALALDEAIVDRLTRAAEGKVVHLEIW